MAIPAIAVSAIAISSVAISAVAIPAVAIPAIAMLVLFTQSQSHLIPKIDSSTLVQHMVKGTAPHIFGETHCRCFVTAIKVSS